MKVLTLVHHELVPPQKFATKEDWAKAPCNTEFDVVKALRDCGHKVEVLGVNDELKPIREAIDRFKPKIVFNLLEEFAGEAIFDSNVVSYLELLNIPYTGCSSRGLMLARDKALAKKILTYHRIPNPAFYVFKHKKNGVHLPKSIKYPLFVKSLTEEASMGITQDSIVNNKEQLLERIKYFKEKIHSAVIAEEYIEGREFYVGIFGNERLKVLPPLELSFKKTGDRVPRIATSKVKWDLNYRKKFGISTDIAKNLQPELQQKINRICKRAYRALGLNGCARLDLRVTEKGEVYVIEVNPNPDIGFKEEFADASEAAGIKYPDLINKLIKLGLAWSRN